MRLMMVFNRFLLLFLVCIFSQSGAMQRRNDRSAITVLRAGGKSTLAVGAAGFAGLALITSFITYYSSKLCKYSFCGDHQNDFESMGHLFVVGPLAAASCIACGAVTAVSAASSVACAYACAKFGPEKQGQQ